MPLVPPAFELIYHSLSPQESSPSLQPGASSSSGKKGKGDDEGNDDSLSVMSHLGLDIFEKLQEALSAGRMRLVDAFKEFDKDADGMLSPEELLKYV